MKKVILMFALFPFLHESGYTVDYVSCKVGEIQVQHEEETIEVTLFNTKITNERGWDHACSLIKNAKRLRMEIDPSTKIEEPLAIYLFADDKLVQEEVIRNQDAYPMIHNPEYLYEKRLEAATRSTTSVMAQAKAKETEHTRPYVALLYTIVFWILWGLMLSYMLVKHHRKKHVKIKKHL